MNAEQFYASTMDTHFEVPPCGVVSLKSLHRRHASREVIFLMEYRGVDVAARSLGTLLTARSKQ